MSETDFWEYFDRYKSYLRAQGVVEGTIVTKETVLKRFYRFALDNNCLKVNEWSSEIFILFLNWLNSYSYQSNKKGHLKKLVKRSIAFSMQTMRSFVRWLYQNDIIYIDPFDKITLPADRKTPIVNDVTENDISKIFEAITTKTPEGIRDTAVIELFYGGALRRGELHKLNIGDIDFSGGSVIVTGKGDKERMIPLGAKTLESIKRYYLEVRPLYIYPEKRNEQAFFLSRKGNRFSTPAISSMIIKYAKRAGVRHVTAHKLRHAFSLHMLRRGCDIRYIQEILGHERLSTTTIYTEIFDYDLMEKIKKFHPGEDDDWLKLL